MTKKSSALSELLFSLVVRETTGDMVFGIMGVADHVPCSAARRRL